MRTLFIFLMACLIGNATFSQCGKTSIISAAKTEYLDASGAVQRTVDENSVIEITPTQVIIVPGREDRKMTGTIASDACDWKDGYKNGKSVIRIKFSREDGQQMNATITVEGKDGKVSFLMEIDERPDRKIRVLADKFSEKS